MSKPLEEGLPALYKYQSVKYHHVDVAPGANLILTADPWSYLYAWLSKQAKKHKGHRKNCLVRAIYYAKLAESFYKAGESIELPAKSTLIYYGMLNIVKCYLSVCYVELGKDYEHHGLSMPIGTKLTVEISSETNGNPIFAKFAKFLKTPITTKETMSLKDIALQIPEIHEMSHNTGIGSSGRRQFLPVEIQILVSQAKDRIFSEIKYEKKHEERVDVDKFYRGQVKDYFRSQENVNNNIIYRSKKRKKLTHNAKSWNAVYKNILKEYGFFNINSILTRDGYRYYCNLHPGKLNQLCYPLILMFYFGSVARYRPAETEYLLSSEWRPIVGEATTMIPTQFLYQMVSRITSSICVLPKALI
jgi:hypothetical protein